MRPGWVYIFADSYDLFLIWNVHHEDSVSLLLDIGCYSHTINHVGEHFVTPVLEQFFKAWVGLFAHSPKA